MKWGYRTGMRVALVLMTAAAVSCSSDLSRSSSPVDLIVTNSPLLFRIDLAGDSAGATACAGDIGTINIDVRQKNLANNVDPRFNDVRLTRYRVSYVRTDGGTAVPAPFVITMDQLVPVGTAGATLSKFVVLRGEALVQAPFASLLPVNGGRDPETGRARIDMDVIVEVFGQTLAGTNVAGTTRFPLEFCFDCGGCA